ncbi:MAG: hypothetical protein HY658_13920 [Actinobacteria bacterium]|nr:hypothetical protein [Actinomycetota bacterium]
MATDGMRGLDRLLDLQEIDLSIDRLEARHRELEGGEEIGAARTLADEAERRLGDMRLELDGLSREQGRLESEADSLSRKEDAERARLYDGSVANPKELEAIRHEVENLVARRGRIEDEVLDLMVRREELDETIRRAEAEHREARDRLTEVRGEAGRELDEIERTLVTRRKEREALVPVIAEDLVELYEELRAQKRGVGAAALVDGVCQGCHQKLSPLELDRMKRVEGPRRCEYCRRILIPR